MHLDIKNLCCPSWNDIQVLHWSKRSMRMSEIKSIVTAEFLQIPRSERVVVPPVRIIIEAHFRGSQRRDPDNIYVKPIIDGMVAAKVIPDDNGKIVESVTLIAKTKMPKSKILISILGQDNGQEEKN